LGTSERPPLRPQNREVNPGLILSKIGRLTIGLLIGLLPILTGCGPSGEPALVIATTWAPSERARFESEGREASGDRRQVVWVILKPWENWESVVDRRGGVDLVLGGPATAFDRLARSGHFIPTSVPGLLPWSVIRPSKEYATIAKSTGDARVDPEFLSQAKQRLAAEGWPKGYEGLVRAALVQSPNRTIRESRSEYVALVNGGPNPARARQWLKALEARLDARSPDFTRLRDVRSDDLLADLLGAALVDAGDELREAGSALVRYGHPTQAEAALGRRPPWPPASVAKLQADLNGQPMVETLLEQIAPDPESRRWLEASWSRPVSMIDGPLLAEIAAAADGKLALEPRFRAWLRGEWTAWTRQLYRRVARVAGGYVPS
jgi:hypothetical protein